MIQPIAASSALMATTLYTIGHGTRPIEVLLEVLIESSIKMLVDVRALPRSRRHPQFNQEALEATLASRGIRYTWRGKALGGFRKPRPDSRHAALRNPALRGFADYMEADAFNDALNEVLRFAGCERVAIMCAEREPAQCHRAMIADAVMLRGVQVAHLIDRGELHPARLSALARAEGVSVVYDGGQPRLLGDA